jgi:hypothetical protein
MLIMSINKIKMKPMRYTPKPPAIPKWAQEALMKYCSKKPA